MPDNTRGTNTNKRPPRISRLSTPSLVITYSSFCTTCWLPRKPPLYAAGTRYWLVPTVPVARHTRALVAVNVTMCWTTPFLPACVSCSKAGIDTIVRSFRHELRIAGIDVSMSTLLLGLIGTESNTGRGDGLSQRAMPVPDCAREMVCAVDLRPDTAYIPQVQCVDDTRGVGLLLL